MLIYLLLCVATYFIGIGIINSLRIPIAKEISLFLAPTVTLSFWTILLAWSVLLGFPIKTSVVPLWLISGIFLSYGIYTCKFKIKLLHLVNLFLCISLPAILIAPCFKHGTFITFPGSPLPDGWAYIAVGQALWKYIRGAEGSLAPLYQYAAFLSHIRFISSALLAFISPITNRAGDTQAVSTLFQIWAIFNLSNACVFFGAIKSGGKLIPIYLGLTIYSGWMLNIISVNNFDNLLILSIFPALAGIIYYLEKPRWQWSILVALIISALFYCYVEFACIILAASGILFLFRLCEINATLKKGLKNYIFLMFGSLLLATLIILPNIKEMYHFFINQVACSHQANSARPGEGFFAELLKPQYLLTALWGLPHTSFAIFLSSLQTLLFLGGCILSTVRRNSALVIICALLLAGAFFMIFKCHYSYGAYKFIIVSWWLITYHIVATISYLLEYPKLRKLILSFFSIVGIIYIIVIYHSINTSYLNLPIKDIRPIRNLETLHSLVKKDSIYVAVNNDLNNVWAVYFLRDFAIKLMSYHLYMATPDLKSQMDNSTKVSSTTLKYLLTDDPLSQSHSNLVWSSGPYYLWKIHEPYCFISNLNSQNGIENWSGKISFWVGTNKDLIQVTSSIQTNALIKAELIAGPSLSLTQTRHLLINVNSTTDKIIPFKNHNQLTLKIHLQQGINNITLNATEKPTILVQPTGDNRIMLIGISNLQILPEK